MAEYYERSGHRFKSSIVKLLYFFFWTTEQRYLRKLLVKYLERLFVAEYVWKGFLKIHHILLTRQSKAIRYANIAR